MSYVTDQVVDWIAVNARPFSYLFPDSLELALHVVLQMDNRRDFSLETDNSLSHFVPNNECGFRRHIVNASE